MSATEPVSAAQEDIAVGVQGGNLLREKLATAKDPRSAIKSFVAENSLKTPSCTPAHELLDLMGFSRADQHRLILNKIKERMLARIPTLPPDKQLALLNKCFRYISIPELRDIPLAIFCELPRIPSSYLLTLAQSQELFAHLPIRVKRQVWSLEANNNLFTAHITSLAALYASQSRVRCVCSGLSAPPGNPRRVRSENKALQEFAATIGDSHLLFGRVLQILRSLYQDSQACDASLCSLRLHLPLALLESGFKMVSEHDPAFKLITTLSNGMREKEKDVVACLNQAEAAIEASLQGHPIDLCLILRSPEVSAFLSQITLSACRRVAEAEGIPKEDRALKAASRLLCMLADEELHEKEHASLPDPARRKERASDQDVACKKLLNEFYPALACSLVDDMIREGAGECEPLEEAFTKFCGSGAARRVLLQYTCNCLAGDTADTEKCLQLLDTCEPPDHTLVADDCRSFVSLSRRLTALLKANIEVSDTRAALLTLALPVLKKARPFASYSAALTVSLVVMLHAAESSCENEIKSELDSLSEIASSLDKEESMACAAVVGSALGDAVKHFGESHPEEAHGLVRLFEEGPGDGERPQGGDRTP